MPFSYTAPAFSEQELKNESENLSEQEKREIHLDLYGQRKPFLETADFVTSKLEELEQQLLSIEDIGAFALAKERCPDYVNGNDFRLLFLRKTMFDVKSAAEHIVNYWNLKVEIFSEEKAFRPCSEADLEDDDVEALRRSTISILPKNDKNGRAILFTIRKSWHYRCRESFLRAWMVLHHKLLDTNIDAQRNGLIIISFDIYPNSPSSENFDRKLSSALLHFIRNCSPFRTVAIHHFFDSSILGFIIQFVMYLMGKEFRQRYCLHRGLISNKERIAALDKFGITREMLPTIMGGTIQLS
mmetsp:Transcript_1052/g.1326  ORF Transcript_1052/g.1326 Transcript_1052/m.1326 type:complete len:299 (-) Transcript_1052:209-1105(-)